MTPANREEIRGKFCGTCACGPNCPALRLAEQSGAWQVVLLVPKCTLHRPIGSAGVTGEDPYTGQLTFKRYQALARDPVTGRPVI